MINLLTLIMACGIYPDTATVNAMIMLGSHNHSLRVTTVMPNDQRVTRDDFKTRDHAAAHAKAQMAQGYVVNMGLLQIPSFWVPTIETEGTSFNELFESCKNVVVGTEILNNAVQACSQMSEQKNLRACGISLYATGNSIKGLAYARSVLKYAALHPMQNNPQNQPLGDQANDAMTAKWLVLPVPKFNDDDLSTTVSPKKIKKETSPQMPPPPSIATPVPSQQPPGPVSTIVITPSTSTAIPAMPPKPSADDDPMSAWAG